MTPDRGVSVVPAGGGGDRNPAVVPAQAGTHPDPRHRGDDRSSVEQTQRLFFALWPPRATAQALFDWATAAHATCGGRVTQADKIHLTLAFLSEITSGRVPDAIHAARAVRGERHRLPLEQARYWPKNQIVRAGPHEVPAALAQLVSELTVSLKGRGFALEERPFAAHVTLIRKARAARELPALPALAWPVGEFALVRSVLSAKGSSYETLERFALT